MPDSFVEPMDLDQAAKEPIIFQLKSTLPIWNRLEARPRAEDFQRSLKAEIRDALWMLTRQWQMGEFISDDAGTPVFCDTEYECAELTDIKNPAGEFKKIVEMLPFEPLVEKQPIFIEGDTRIMNLDTRVQLGNYWSKLLKANGLEDLKILFLEKYPIVIPPNEFENGYIHAHQEVLQSFSLFNQRGIDGYLLFTKLESEFEAVLINTGTVLHSEVLKNLYNKFKAWYTRLYLQPSINDNFWQSSKLEYHAESKFGLKSENDKVNIEKELVSEEYYHGRLDWYNFDLNRITENILPTDFSSKSETIKIDHLSGPSLLPAPVRFEGMPDSRYWTFEEGGTNFAAIDVSHLDLAKLVLIEFGLIYSNDWSLIPFKIPMGSVTDVKYLAVTDSFGFKTFISSANKGADDTWDKWAFFSLNHLSSNATQQSDNNLFLPPAIHKAHQSKPIEEVYFIRDEMANICWGIETVIASAKGGGKSGRENVNLLSNYLNTDSVEGVEPNERLLYKEMTEVPANWIPFIPVHPKDSNRDIQFQRGAMLNSKKIKIKPLTSILRVGLDQIAATPYYIHEEELPRAGLRISKSFKRTRWTNGEVYVWIGIQKQTGKGEGSSRLEFDQIEYRAVGGRNYGFEKNTGFVVWRPGEGNWYILKSSDGTQQVQQWGLPGDIPMPNDYDGDGRIDFGVWRPSEGNWHIIKSSDGFQEVKQWGLPGDIPVRGDFDGDGKADFAVWRPNEGSWYVLTSSGNSRPVQQWGWPEDIPVPGDYDGDGKTDCAVWRPSEGNWYILNSTNGVGHKHSWGLPGDIPVPGDYDGDGKTDFAVWRPNEGNWYIIKSSDGTQQVQQWGWPDDIPVPGDYDGDGKTDFAVWRPSEGNWYILNSSDGTPHVQQWGLPGDIPIIGKR